MSFFISPKSCRTNCKQIREQILEQIKQKIESNKLVGYKYTTRNAKNVLAAITFHSEHKTLIIYTNIERMYGIIVIIKKTLSVCSHQIFASSSSARDALKNSTYHIYSRLIPKQFAVLLILYTMLSIPSKLFNINICPIKLLHGETVVDVLFLIATWLLFNKQCTVQTYQDQVLYIARSLCSHSVRITFKNNNNNKVAKGKDAERGENKRARNELTNQIKRNLPIYNLNFILTVDIMSTTNL